MNRRKPTPVSPPPWRAVALLCAALVVGGAVLLPRFGAAAPRNHFVPRFSLAPAAALALGLGGNKGPVPHVSPAAREWEPVRPVPLTVNVDPLKAALGQKMFHERALSHDGSVSCATCHDLGKGGTDGLARSNGIHQTKGKINAPTVFNSGANFRQFWDGRAATLEEQVNGPVESAEEMGSNWGEVVAKLRAMPAYVTGFAQAYHDGIQPANIRSAIAEFERSLITPNSRFDYFLRGNDRALTADEQEGYRKFKSHGCTSCHQGVNVGGNMFETLGAMADYFADRGSSTTADLGRFNVTGREEDRHVFKVPSLRNVALTAPYLHDGSAQTLEEVVAVMARYQLGRTLPDEDIGQIVQFLKSLTGEYGGKPL